MPGVDGSVRELETYQSHVTLPGDFDSFWESRLEALRDVPLLMERIPLDSYIRNVTVEQITYESLEGILHRARIFHRTFWISHYLSSSCITDMTGIHMNPISR